VEAYDPLDYETLADNIVRALESRPLSTLPPDRFVGAGVYAVYYTGRLEMYAPLVARDELLPIYVGSAAAGGGRKGEPGFAPSRGYELHRRLTKHAESVDAATNLELKDFKCRYLVVLPAWIVVAERILLTKYQPVWNRACDGFGMHDVGERRRTGKRPRWDTLHPGRHWSANMSPGDSLEDIMRDVAQVLCGTAPPEL